MFALAIFLVVAKAVSGQTLVGTSLTVSMTVVDSEGFLDGIGTFLGPTTIQVNETGSRVSTPEDFNADAFIAAEFSALTFDVVLFSDIFTRIGSDFHVDIDDLSAVLVTNVVQTAGPTVNSIAFDSSSIDVIIFDQSLDRYTTYKWTFAVALDFVGAHGDPHVRDLGCLCDLPDASRRAAPLQAAQQRRRHHSHVAPH